MNTGDTKYYRVKQILKNRKPAGHLVLIGRQYGYIVQLHYYDTPGYKVNTTFEYIEDAAEYFNEILKTEVENNE
jgi:hypothetical protein